LTRCATLSEYYGREERRQEYTGVEYNRNNSSLTSKEDSGFFNYGEEDRR
jgi:hypothetical protein